MRTASLLCRPRTNNVLRFRHHRMSFRFAKVSLLSPHRCVSTTSATTNVSATTPIVTAQSKVNAPATTLPAPLIIPDRLPNQSFFPSYAFTVGKVYLQFYKTGVKAIFTNFLACRPIQSVLDSDYNGSLSAGIASGFLSRSDFQLLLRSWFDVKRVPIFALVFAICGEFTPLVVLAITNVVPYTCRIPKQVEADRRKMESRRSISFRNLTADLPANSAGVKDLGRMQLLHICWSLGLSSSAWDWLGGQLPGLPTSLLRNKVRERVEYLKMDDTLITRDGGVKDMSLEEVELALVDRGVDILGKSEDQKRHSINAWLRAVQRVPRESLLLTRPSVWPSKRI